MIAWGVISGRDCNSFSLRLSSTCSETGDVSTEAETRLQIRRKGAVTSGGLVPLGGYAALPVAGGNRDRN